mmetsp:Transcript_44498/g.83096  ORF Transcript_44498/g.83096 Transcript_44498/m.83096 type:complete len:206 (-) Transcript_44498:289-906(-)
MSWRSRASASSARTWSAMAKETSKKEEEEPLTRRRGSSVKFARFRSYSVNARVGNSAFKPFRTSVTIQNSRALRVSTCSVTLLNGMGTGMAMGRLSPVRGRLSSSFRERPSGHSCVYCRQRAQSSQKKRCGLVGSTLSRNSSPTSGHLSRQSSQPRLVQLYLTISPSDTPLSPTETSTRTSWCRWHSCHSPKRRLPWSQENGQRP